MNVNSSSNRGVVLFVPYKKGETVAERKNRHHLTCGGLVEITRRRLSELSVICHAMWCGLMKRRITCFISTRVHLRSHRTTICARLSGDTIKASAHVVPDWPYPLRTRSDFRRQVHQRGKCEHRNPHWQ